MITRMIRTACLAVLLTAGLAAVAMAASASQTAAESDYQAARYSPLHFKPASLRASNEQCLACHAEVLKPSVREASVAGVKAADSLAWYQQLRTYEGAQDTFHRRHFESKLAKRLMNLQCNTCHEGIDPRDRTPESSADRRDGGFALRKTVDPEATCLKCHGQMPWQNMGLPGHWSTTKTIFQDNCLICHATIRTVRHQVNYLKPKEIEAAGWSLIAYKSDLCFGCHGGRPWYRISYPYPRHPWPGMTGDTPAWAKGRPTVSESRFIENRQAQ
jgi:hypothetical protein